MSGEAPHEIYDRRRARLAATGVGLGLLVVLIFTVTLVKLRENATSPFAEIFKPQIQTPQTRSAEPATPPGSVAPQE